jgi:phosphate transport system protein
MSTPHRCASFDRELDALSDDVMQLAGLVEAQTRDAMQALENHHVIDTDARVNDMEMSLDRALYSVMGRRQPIGSDLRLLTAIAKTTTQLERIGDEAKRIARMLQSLMAREGGECTLLAAQLQVSAQMASSQLRNALDAFVRQDARGAVSVLRQDRLLDQEFHRFLQAMASRMAQEPRAIACGVDLVFVARAIERIGDHAKNIAECAIYVISGADVRHTPIEQIDTLIR